MICDMLKNAHLYAGISTRLARAFEVLADSEVVHWADGRYEIDGDRVYCLIQRYTSRPPEKCNLEAHRNYIDVQFIVSGEEFIRLARPDDLEVCQSYDSATDKALFVPRTGMTALRLGAGSFGVFFPHDAHMSCLQVDGPAEVHKIVVKVRRDR